MQLDRDLLVWGTFCSQFQSAKQVLLQFENVSNTE
jgi:hypothetical protein